MSDDRDTCVYQPREFSKPTLERLTEIVRDELYSIQVLFNDACLRPILVQQLPDPLPEIVDSMASLDCCGIIVRDCTPTIPVDCPELDPVDDFLIQKVCDVEDGLGVAGAWARSAAVLSGDAVTQQQIQPRTTIEGSVVHPWYRRTFNVLTGVQASVETVLAQVPGNSTTANVYGVIGGSTTLAYMFSQTGFGSTYRRWIVDGVTDTEQFTWPAGHVVLTGSNLALSQRGHYIPGRGVYYITGFASPAEIWLTLYSRVEDNGLPARTPTATFRIYEGASPYTSVDIIGPAPDGRLVVRLAGLLLNLYVDLDTGVVEQRADPAWPALVNSVSIITPFPYSIGKNSNVNSRTIYVQRTDGEPLAAANYDPGEGVGTGSIAGGISLGRNLIFHPGPNKVWALSEVCLGVSEAPGPPEWLCREVIGQNGIRVTNGRGQGGDITVEMDVDCCGIIVRDCSVLGEGGTWGYSNFEFSQLAARQLTGGAGREFMTIRDATFEDRTDERIVVVDDNYLRSTGASYTVELVDNALATTTASSVANAGDSPGDNRITVHGVDYPTGLYFSSDPNFGYAEVGSAGSHLRLLAPFAEVTAGWFFGEANCNPEWSGLVWFRGGALYHGVRRTGNGCENYNRVMKFTGLVAGAERLLPVASILNVDDGLSNFTMYVNPAGSDVWVCPGDDTWSLARYNSSLALQESFNVSYAKRGLNVGFKGFAVMGDFLFEVQGRIVTLWRLSTSAKLAEYTVPSSVSAVARHSNILLPHPDGTLYLQMRLSAGDNQNSTVYALKFADAVFTPPPPAPVWTCTEILSGDAFLTVINGDAQGGDPTITLNDLPISKITGLQAELDSKLTVEGAAVYQFLSADNMPYKQFVYDTGLLVTINLYDDAGLTNLRYSKALVRSGDFLTSIVLTRHPDMVQWSKVLAYNIDEALEAVSTAAV